MHNRYRTQRVQPRPAQASLRARSLRLYDHSDAAHLRLVRFQDHHAHPGRPPGHAEAFVPVPDCGVVVTFILDLDQKNVGYKFRDPPDNAKWAEDEDGAVKVLAFSDEIVVPASMPDFISPFIAISGRYDSDKYRKDETSRQRFARQLFG